MSLLENTKTMLPSTLGHFLAIMGSVAAIAFCGFGAAYGTAKAGTGIAAAAVMRPEMIMKSLIPVVMAGILGIYGLVISILIISDMKSEELQTHYQGYTKFGSGLAVGLCGLASGWAIGVVGDAGVRGSVNQPRLFIGMILILIFAEVIGLYGLIVSIYLYVKK